MSKWNGLFDKVKAQAQLAGAQAQSMIQVGFGFLRVATMPVDRYLTVLLTRPRLTSR